MRELTEYFGKKDIIFKNIEEVAPKELGSRKKIEIYSALGVDKSYYCIFVVNSKSRFVRKSAVELLDLLEKLSTLKEHNFKKKYLLISSPLCSKAKAMLEDEYKWSVRVDFM